MKKLLIGIMAMLPFVLDAQNNAPELYDEMCEPLQAVFCDYVRDDADLRLISNMQGRYLGTMIDDALYGWGYYQSSTGAQSFGQYRKGKMIFGLVLSEDVAKVGSPENYVVYDLYSGDIKRVHTDEGDVELSYPFISKENGEVSPYSFKKETYSNGDVFYGEFYNGRRHGYGVYCWTNGDIWYGRYKDGYRNGYGMLIKSGNMIYYGKWVGDSKVVE
jgi:hypothetical protein